MIQFFAPDIETTHLLPESDSQHAIRVLRKSAGDVVEVVDGKGCRYRCRIVDPHPKHAGIEIIERKAVKPAWNNHITIAVAPTKHLDRMEWLVEKLTEIGVNRITPLRCRHSERKELKRNRLEKIAVSAMKQSLKATLPIVDEMTDFKHFVTSDIPPQRFIAYCDDYIERKALVDEYHPDEDTAILIGPEGDFSPEEVSLAFDNGFRPVTLGNNRLRTETAALVACDTFHILNQYKSSH